MNAEELQVILDNSRLYWISDGKEGSKANLTGANLSEANLVEANLSEANLIEANLHRANLYEAILSEANLSGADLRWANFYRASLRWANFYRANLLEADLGEADLHRANLSGANLSGADLTEANLSGAHLHCTIGNGKEIRSMQIEDYPIVYTSSQLAIGCKQYPIEEWKNPSFLRGKNRELWDKHSPLIWTILEKYPARPTSRR